MVLRRRNARYERNFDVSCAAKRSGVSDSEVSYPKFTEDPGGMFVPAALPPKEMMPRDVSSPSVGCGQSQRSPTESNAVSVEQFSFLLIYLFFLQAKET